MMVMEPTVNSGRKIDCTLDEATSIVDTIGSVLAHEGNGLTPQDIFDIVERLERVQYLLLTAADRRKHYSEESMMAA